MPAYAQSRVGRFGAVAFMHRFGSTRHRHRHFPCVVIAGVFDAAAAGGVIVPAAPGLDAPAFAQVPPCVRRRRLRVVVRRGLRAGDAARAMAHGEPAGGFAVDTSVRIAAAGRARRRR